MKTTTKTSVKTSAKAPAKETAKTPAKATTKSSAKSSVKAPTTTTKAKSTPAKSTQTKPAARAKTSSTSDTKSATKEPATPAKAAVTGAAVGAAVGTAAGAATAESAASHPPATGGTGSFQITGDASLHEAPDASSIGQLRSGTRVDVLARDRGWVRVRSEGWVRESDLTPTDSGVRSASAADVRSNPARWRGATVKWTVQYLSLQTADTLRSGLAAGERYLLARGPDTESALMYLVLPSNALGMMRALPPLTKITVVARVRDGRSEPAGVPILEIQSLQPVK